MAVKHKKTFSPSRVTGFDPTSMVEKVIQSGLDARVLEQIDDSDITWAPNFKSWVMDSKFSGHGMPFPRQLEHGTKFLGEYCPRKKCTDMKFWNDMRVNEDLNEILDRVTFLEFGVCPKCKRTRNELIASGKLIDYNEMAGVAGMRSTKCLSLDEITLTSQGIMSMREVMDANGLTDMKDGEYRPFLIGVYGDGRKVRTSHFYKDGRSLGYKVTTRSGHSIHGTGKHRIKVWDAENSEFKMIRLDEVQPGHYACIQRGMEAWPKQNLVEPDKAFVMGFLAGDGHCSQLNKITVTKDEKSVAYYAAAVKKLYPQARIHTKAFKRKRTNHFETHNVLASIYDGTIKADLGLEHNPTSLTKKYPRNVLRSGRETNTAFLRGLFATDGSVAQKQVTLVLSNYDLISHARMVLLNLGIVTHLSSNIPKGKRTNGKPYARSYRLAVSTRRSLAAFAETIGFIPGTKRQHDLDRLIKQMRGAIETGRIDTIPVKSLMWTAAQKLRAQKLQQILMIKAQKGTVPRGYGGAIYSMEAALDSEIPCGYKGDGWKFISTQDSMNRCVAERALAEFEKSGVCDEEASILRDLLQRDYFFDPIEEVVREEGDFVDFSIPDEHLFFASGFVNHNSVLVGAMIAPYHLHRVLRLHPNPSLVYGQQSHQVLQMSFCAVTAGQARETIWSDFVGALVESPWFMDYKKLLTGHAKDLGDERIEPKFLETLIAFPHKHLIANFVTPDMRSIRGRTRIFAACVSPDTLVGTERGLMTIEKAQQEATKARSEKGRLRHILQHFDREAEAVAINTRLGYELAGSLDHPIRVLTGRMQLAWKQLKDIEIGDTVVITKMNCLSRKRLPVLPEVLAVRTNNQRFYPPKKLTLETARMLGYLCSEGSIGKERIKVFTPDKEILADYVACFTATFNHAPTVTPNPISPGWDIVAQSAIVERWLKAVGASGKAATKKVPWVILEAPKEYAVQWIRGYFDGDGTLDKNICLKAESASVELHKQLQVLLLSLGIVSSRQIHHRKFTKKSVFKRKVTRTYSCLSIFGESLERYRELIGSVLPHKMVKKTRRNAAKEFIYINAEKVVRANAKAIALGYSTQGYLCEDGEVRRLSLKSLFSNRYKMTRSWLLKKVNWPGVTLVDSKLAKGVAANLFDDSLLFDQVRLKTSLGKTRVLDIEVDEDHSFISNGFRSHNCDELGWFPIDSQAVRANADETHSALTRSLRTVRSAYLNLIQQGHNDIPNAIMANISSPAEVADKIMCLLRESRTNPFIYGFHHATWEMNPTIKEDDPSLRAEAKSEEAFLRDYAAIPPLASARFMNDDDAIFATVEHHRPPMFRQKIIRSLKGGKDQYLYAKPEVLVRDTRHPRILTVDTGETRNSFTACLSHVEFTGVTPVMMVDGVVEVVPDDEMSVSFPKMFDSMILELIKQYNVYFVVYDRWQSTDQVQRLDSEETFPHLPYRERVQIDKPKKKNPRLRDHLNQGQVQVDRFSLKYSHFTEIVRPRIYSGAVKLPAMEKPLDLDSLTTSFEEAGKKAPITSLVLQMLRVREVGQKVTKPLAGSDDVFRSLALGIVYAFDAGVQEILKLYTDSNGMRTSLKRAGLGAMVSRGSAATSSFSGQANSHPFVKVITRSNASKSSGAGASNTGALGSRRK